MDDRSIPIIIDNKINPVFIKANTFLLERYKDKFDYSGDNKNNQCLEKLWQENFNAELVKNSTGLYTEIVFLSQSERTVFLLKHGM